MVDKNRLINSLLIASMLLFTLFMENTLQMYLSNIYGYTFSFMDYLLFFLLIFVFFDLILTTILYFLPNAVSYVLFVIALLIFIQSNFMVWSYGVLDGSTIRWGRFFYYGIIDSIVWVLVIVLCILKRESIKKYIRQISIIAIGFEIVFIVLSMFSTNVFKSEKNTWFKHYTLTNNLSLSKNKNVIVLLLDMAQSDIFPTMLKEEPIFQDIYKDFIFYPDFLGATPYTVNSVAPILTGEMYKYQTNRTEFLVDAFSGDSSIIKRLGDNSYDSNVMLSAFGSLMDDLIYIDPNYVKNAEKKSFKNRRYIKSSLLEIFDLSVFRALPHFLKRTIYNNGNFFFQIYLNKISLFHAKEKKAEVEAKEKMFSDAQKIRPKAVENEKIDAYEKIRSILNNPVNRDTTDLVLLKNIVNNTTIIDKDCFSYIHFDSPHTPYMFDRDGNYVGNRDDRDIENYKDKYVYGLKLTYIFLDYLKKNNIYDNSLIIIVGDHGTHTGLENSKEYTLAQKNKANPLLLIKPFERTASNIATNNSEVSTFDIPSIVFNATGLEMNNKNFITDDNLKNSDRHYYSISVYKGAPIYDYRVDGNLKLDSSWHSTGDVYTSRGTFHFLKSEPIPKSFFKSEFLDKLEESDRTFILSTYDDTSKGYVLKEAIDDESMKRLLHILTMELNFFAGKGRIY